MVIGLLEGAPEIWKVAVATGPSGITVLLNPATMQGFPFPLHVTVFPAAVDDAPATTVKLVMSEEKANVHWRPEVCAPPAEVRLIGRTTVPPAVPVVDANERVTLCPRAAACKPSRTKVLRRKLRATLVYRPRAISGQWDFYLGSNGNPVRGVIRAHKEWGKIALLGKRKNSGSHNHEDVAPTEESQ